MARFETLKLLICQGEQATSIASRVIFMVGFIFSLVSWSMTEEQIIAALSLPENSTGNIADAIEEATGARGWRSADMKPNFDSRVVATVCDEHRLLRGLVPCIVAITVWCAWAMGYVQRSKNLDRSMHLTKTV